MIKGCWELGIYQINSIVKSHRDNPYEAILAIGGITEQGQIWKLTQIQAIEAINSGRYQFFVQINGKSIDVIVAHNDKGMPYIKTKADDDVPYNLLSLQEGWFFCLFVFF